MGYDLTLVATPAARLENVLRAAHLKVTEAHAQDGDTVLSIGKVGQQAIFWRDNHVLPATQPIDFEGLSKIAPMLSLDVIDSAGAQSVAYYDEGEEIWSVSFSADDPDFLAMTGEIPVDMERLTAEAEQLAKPAEGETVLYADQTPSLIFLELTGFAHDQSDRTKFRVVEGDLVASKSPWWKFW